MKGGGCLLWNMCTNHYKCGRYQWLVHSRKVNRSYNGQSETRKVNRPNRFDRQKKHLACLTNWDLTGLTDWADWSRSYRTTEESEQLLAFPMPSSIWVSVAQVNDQSLPLCWSLCGAVWKRRDHECAHWHGSSGNMECPVCLGSS